MGTLNISLKLKRIVISLAALASIVGIPLAGTQTVFADSNCFSGDICFWQHNNSGGWKLEYYPARYNCTTIPSAYWDQVSSYWNRTGHVITAYTLENCTGIGWDIAGTEYIGSIGWPFNDEMRSFYSY